MDFYKMLAVCYDAVFPVNSKLLSLCSAVTPEGGAVLDVGCATGALIRALDKKGFDVTGVEYEPELIGFPEKTVTGDMHSLAFPKDSFDTLICTGNTLVHGESAEDISGILHGFKDVLKPGGTAIVQILNYEMILNKKPDSLPVVSSDAVVFERGYEYQGERVKFTGRLTYGGETQSSSVMLYPLTLSQLAGCTADAGLVLSGVYSDFGLSDFDTDASLPLVAIIKKAAV